MFLPLHIIIYPNHSQQCYEHVYHIELLTLNSVQQIYIIWRMTPKTSHPFPDFSFLFLLFGTEIIKQMYILSGSSVVYTLYGCHLFVVIILAQCLPLIISEVHVAMSLVVCVMLCR